MLATALNSLSTVLALERRFGDALAYGREALELRCSLLKQDPASEPEFLGTLTNVAIYTTEAGDCATALLLHQEVVARLRELVTRDRLTYTRSLAGALGNLARCLFQDEQREEAVGVSREAVGLYWSLMGVDASAHAAEFGIALDNLAVQLDAVGCSEAAAQALAEAESVRLQSEGA